MPAPASSTRTIPTMAQAPNPPEDVSAAGLMVGLGAGLVGSALVGSAVVGPALVGEAVGDAVVLDGEGAGASYAKVMPPSMG